MNLSPHPIRRFATRFTPECLAAGGSAFYGVHVWLARFFGGPHPGSAFATILPPSTVQSLETLLLIVLPLLTGAACQAYGLCRRRRVAIMLGTLLEFFVFTTALISCLLGNPWGTGIGAYLFLSGLCLLLFLYRSLRIEWIPSA